MTLSSAAATSRDYAVTALHCGDAIIAASVVLAVLHCIDRVFLTGCLGMAGVND